VPHAADSVAAARAAGLRTAFVTNNASRRPAAVAEALTALGIPADPADVVTSAQAAVRWLAERLPAGSPVLVLGSDGLAEEVAAGGLRPVRQADELPRAVVQGLAPETGWRELAEACVAVRAGALWVAGNADSTYPSPRGPLPGNGAMVAALATATGAEPVVVGKPSPELHRESVERVGALHPLVVGDRLDTDIEGARRVGCASLLVFSGVTTPLQVLSASELERPDYLSYDVDGLLEAHPKVSTTGVESRCGRWVARVDGPRLRLSCLAGSAPDGSNSDRDRDGDSDREDGGSGGASGEDDRPEDGAEVGRGRAGADALDALRALCAQTWTSGIVETESTDDESRAVLRRLGLSDAATEPSPLPSAS
jgi:HAD superfamily hydrolase (TIGR01450 family)